MNESNTLGQRIQAGRKAAGLSQEALGEQLGVSRQAVSKWESDIAIPELENLIAMSRMFGVPVGVLLGVEKEEDALTLSEQELQAAQAIAEKYAEQLKPTPRPRWLLGASAAVLVLCAVILGMVQYRANHRIADLNEQLITLQMQMNNIQNGVAGQLSGFTSEMQKLLQEQENILLNSQVEVTALDLAQEQVTVKVSVVPKEQTAYTTARFIATLPDGSQLVENADIVNDTFTVSDWVLPMGNILLTVTFNDGSVARTGLVDTLVFNDDAFRLRVGSSLTNFDTRFDGDFQYLDGIILSIDCNYVYPADIALCVYRNDSATPEQIIHASDQLVQDIRANPDCSFAWSDHNLNFPRNETDTVDVVLRVTDNLGQVHYDLTQRYYYLNSYQNDKPILPDGWQPGESIK